MNNNYLYIFVHVPKTGGSTLRKHIEKNVPVDERLLIAHPELRFESKNQHKEYWRVIKILQYKRALILPLTKYSFKIRI
jgi:hypothetical protein